MGGAPILTGFARAPVRGTSDKNVIQRAADLTTFPASIPYAAPTKPQVITSHQTRLPVTTAAHRALQKIKRGCPMHVSAVFAGMPTAVTSIAAISTVMMWPWPAYSLSG